MEDKVNIVYSIQDEVDDIVKEFRQQPCSAFEEFKISFTKLECVLQDTTDYIEKIDRNLSDIERDILSIRKMLDNQDK